MFQNMNLSFIKRLGFSRQKARPHHPEKDEAAQEAFKGGSPNA